MRRILLALILSLVLIGPSFAESKIGIVDGEKLFDEYPTAQNASKKIAEAQEELRTTIEDSEKSYAAFEKQSKSQIEKDAEQKKLQAKIDQKAASTREMIESLSKQLEQDITNAISSVSKQKGLEIVFDKRAVLVGGVDITADVSAHLKNKSLAEK